MKNFRHQQRPKKSSLVIGRGQVLQALQTGELLDRIYLENNIQGAEIDKIRQSAAIHNVPINYVPIAKLNAFNVTGHDGCVAQKAKIQYQDLQEVISFEVDKGVAPLFLMLDGITDIRNIGGDRQNSFCMGVNALIIPDKGIGALNEDAILTSAGALEHIPVCRVNSLMKSIDLLHSNGIAVFASEMNAKKNVAEINFKDPCAIIIGSEEKGIYPALLKVADEKFKIPMKGDFESLNVSVASGMILYEVSIQRK